MVNVIVSASVFIIAFYFIISEKINRTIASLAGAVLMIVCGEIWGFYSQVEALKSIDFNTIGLLMGMMVIVSVLKGTGFFTFLAIKAAKISRGNPWRLVVLMGCTTAVVSMLVDNVTTIILVGPITILVCDILGISPLPALLAEILLSNIGGVGTLVGDPPNMMIASASHFTFNEFLTHLLPFVIVTMAVSVFILKIMFRKELKKEPSNVEAVLRIEERNAIRDRATLNKCLLSLGVVVVLFLLEKQLHLYPSFIAIIGAVCTLILVQPNLEEVLRGVEWSVLLFFACLFVMVGGIEKGGILSFAAERITALAETNLALSKLSVLWFSAASASLVNSIPFTAAMIPVIKHLGVLGITVKPFWWILALGVGFGCNGLPMGSTAGIIGMAMSDKTRAPINYKRWLITGTVIAIVSIVVGSISVFVF